MELEIKNKGFTLIELIVAMAVFSLIVVTMGATAVSVIKTQRKAIALQNVQESARYILESVSKEIRMSKIRSDAGNGETTLKITNSKGEDINYQFNSNKLYRYPEGGSLGPDYLISPANLEVTGSFYIRKSDSPVRAAVTIVMQIKSTGGRAEGQAEIYLQSTISSRAF